MVKNLRLASYSFASENAAFGVGCSLLPTLGLDGC